MTRILRAAWLLSCLLLLSTGVFAQDDLLARTNQLRAQFGLGAYRMNGALTSAAQNQAVWMATTQNVSHVQSDGSRPRDRAAAAGFNSPWVSENIYAGTMASTDTAWSFWINSAIHYAALTSPNYTDVGIASATGDNFQAFVMVFGGDPQAVPDLPPPITGASAPPDTGGTGQTGSAAQAPATNGGGGAAAPYVRQRMIVGMDALGNMMHEVQEGDTLGDIAMMYGYSWDVIPTVMFINRMDEAAIRNIKVGSVLLVPPHEGTYTPTPVPPTPTMLPTVTPYSLSAFETPLVSVTPSPPMVVAMVGDASTYVAPSSTPEAVISAPLPTLTPTPVPAAAKATGGDYRLPLLVIVIGVQGVFLGIGVVELWRRRQKTL